MAERWQFGASTEGHVELSGGDREAEQLLYSPQDRNGILRSSGVIKLSLGLPSPPPPLPPYTPQPPSPPNKERKWTDRESQSSWDQKGYFLSPPT